MQWQIIGCHGQNYAPKGWLSPKFTVFHPQAVESGQIDIQQRFDAKRQRWIYPHYHQFFHRFCGLLAVHPQQVENAPAGSGQMRFGYHHLRRRRKLIARGIQLARSGLTSVGTLAVISAQVARP